MRCSKSRFISANTALALLCLPLAASASELDVRLAYARADGASWLVTTRVDIELDAEAEQLVRDGLRLRVEVEFAVAKPRPLIRDTQLASALRTVYLEYDPQAERFVVSSPSADARGEFATMFSALRKIGYMADQPVAAEDQLQPGQPHLFSVQARLFPEESGWWRRNVIGRLGFGLILQSETYTWSVTPQQPLQDPIPSP